MNYNRNKNIIKNMNKLMEDVAAYETPVAKPEPEEPGIIEKAKNKLSDVISSAYNYVDDKVLDPIYGKASEAISSAENSLRRIVR